MIPQELEIEVWSPVFVKLKFMWDSWQYPASSRKIIFFSPQEICFFYVSPAPPLFPGHISCVKAAPVASHSGSHRASSENKLINLNIWLQCFPDPLPSAHRSPGPAGLAWMSWSELPQRHHIPRPFTIPAEFSGAGIWQLLSPQNLVSVGIGSFIMGSAWTNSSVRWPGAEVTLVIKRARGRVLTTFLLLLGTQPHSISAVCFWRQSQSLHLPSLTVIPSGPEGTDPLFYLKTSSWRCGLRERSVPFLWGTYFPLHISSQPDLFKHQKYLCKYIQRG